LPIPGAVLGFGHTSYQLPTETWRVLRQHFGPSRNRAWKPPDLRADVEDAIGHYLAEATRFGSQQMDRKRLVARGRRIATAARALREDLCAGDDVNVQTAERVYFRRELAATWAGAWVDWDALLPILTAIEDAADAARTRLPRARGGPWQDDAYKDLVARLAMTYRHWTGDWPSMSRDRQAESRAEQPWDYTGPFADILATIVPHLRVGHLHGGLGDVAALHLELVRQIDERQQAGRSIASLLVPRKSRS
jgi:hypothetical protein